MKNVAVGLLSILKINDIFKSTQVLGLEVQYDLAKKIKNNL